MAVVETERHGQVLVVRMNRPERLNALSHEMRSELAKVIAMPEVAEAFAKTGGRIMKLSPAETEALLKRDVDRWTKLIQDAGLGGGT